MCNKILWLISSYPIINIEEVLGKFQNSNFQSMPIYWCSDEYYQRDRWHICKHSFNLLWFCRKMWFSTLPEKSKLNTHILKRETEVARMTSYQLAYAHVCLKYPCIQNTFFICFPTLWMNFCQNTSVVFRKCYSKQNCLLTMLKEL